VDRSGGPGAMAPGNSTPAPNDEPLSIPQGLPPQAAVDYFIHSLAQHGVVMQPSLAFLH